MRVEFGNKRLLELYQTGKSKKYNSIRGSLLEKFFMRIQSLEAAVDIYDLWATPAVNFEKLTGHENRYSCRLNIEWRLEMEIDWENPEKKTGTIRIVELSKHYGD